MLLLARGNGAQPAERFQTCARPVIRAFPFADFWPGRIHVAFRRDAPEPFAVNAIHQAVLDKIPDAPGGGKKFRVAGKLEGVKETDDRLGLRPAFLARINDFSAFPLVPERAVAASMPSPSATSAIRKATACTRLSKASSPSTSAASHRSQVPSMSWPKV